MKYWLRIQQAFDVKGDVIMLVFSSVIMWRIAHGGLGEWDAAAYASAVAAFAYSNK